MDESKVPAENHIPADPETIRQELNLLRRENAMLRLANRELERIATRDTLTPLYNRRHFISALHDRIGRVDRYGLKAVVMFVDVDNMKRINDRHGHSAGDFALIHMAHLIQQSIRATDVAARIGGDEFAIILDEIDLDDAAHKQRVLDDIIRSEQCWFEDCPLPISASFGCTRIEATDTEFTVIARADTAMYEQKRQRRQAAG